MSFPTDKSAPRYKAREDEEPGYRRSAKFYRHLYRHWPEWCACHPGFDAIHAECEQRRQQGEDVEIEHIVPLTNELVSGLHVPWNLRIVVRNPDALRVTKSWPGAPFEQLEIGL